jgi:hypothetical protein
MRRGGVAPRAAAHAGMTCPPVATADHFAAVTFQELPNGLIPSARPLSGLFLNAGAARRPWRRMSPAPTPSVRRAACPTPSGEAFGS